MVQGRSRHACDGVVLLLFSFGRVLLLVSCGATTFDWLQTCLPQAANSSAYFWHFVYHLLTGLLVAPEPPSLSLSLSIKKTKTKTNNKQLDTSSSGTAPFQPPASCMSFLGTFKVSFQCPAAQLFSDLGKIEDLLVTSREPIFNEEKWI